MLSMPYSFGALGATIQKELAPVPGRLTTLWRYLIACAIVIVVSMALQIPFLALSLIAIFSTTLQNTFLTRLSGLLATAGLTLALACTLLLLRFTFDVALLRILGSMLILLGAMYFLRTSKLGGIGFLMGLAVIYVQSEVDIIPNPELLARAVLWVWVAITYPIAVNILVGQLLPASADAHLRMELHAQLESIANRIKGAQSGMAGTEEAFLRMHRHLTYALMEHPKLVHQNARCRARVRLVERLLVAAGQLPAADSPDFKQEYQRHAPIVLAAIHQLQSQLAEDADFVIPPALPDYAAVAPAPLAAMYRAFLELVRDEAPRESGKSPAAGAKAAVSGLNTTALQFALKVVLATQLGYLFFTAVQWPGIHTCMLTCIILAMPGLGAITHKGVMRLIGAAVGSLAALLATVFVIPHLDSITGLLLLSLAVIAFGAWISAGSPLTDYVGFQLVFCFALALLGKFGPSTDLTEIRDRAVGIVVGVIISLVVYGWIWPEREAGQAPSTVADLLRALSRVAAACGSASKGEHEQAQADAWSVIERLRQLQGRLAFEPRNASPGAPAWSLDLLLNHARQILLDFDWLSMLPGDDRGGDPHQKDALAAAGKSASDHLRNMAAYAAAMPPGIPARLDEHMAATLPADDIALTVFNSINHQLAQLQQCLLSKS
jgi:multidrug resistance protein MdtO